MTAEEYMNRIGMKNVTAEDSFHELANRVGFKKANSFMELMDKNVRHKVSTDTVYSIKNTKLNESIAYTDVIQGQSIRKIFQILEQHRELINGKVLDIGCENGLITCFAAISNPNAEFVGIDTNHAAINIAKQLAQSLELKNIQFIEKSLENVSECYDTVFVNRVLMENFAHFEMNYCEEFDWNCQKYENAIDGFVSNVSKTLKSNGNLLSLERIGRNVLTMAWLKSLNKHGIGFLQCESVDVEENDRPHTFLSFIGKKGVCKTEKEIEDLCNTVIMKKMPTNRAEYYYIDGENYLYFRRGYLIGGYNVYGKKGKYFRMSLWKDRYDATTILLQQANSKVDFSRVGRLENEMKNYDLSVFRQDIKNEIQAGKARKVTMMEYDQKTNRVTEKEVDLNSFL